MFYNNPKGNSKKSRRGNNSSNPMLNIPRYDTFGNPVPNRLMAADLGNAFDPMLTPNLDKQAAAQEFGGDEDIRALENIFGATDLQSNRMPQLPPIPQLPPVPQMTTIPRSQGNYSHIDNILDTKVLGEWKAYVETQNFKSIRTGSSKVQHVNEFFEYLRSRPQPIKKPSQNDIIEFVKNRHYTKEITLSTAKCIIGNIGNFFYWTSRLGIYPDIFTDNITKQIEEMYNQQSDNSSKIPGITTTIVLSRREKFQEIMKDYPEHKLDPDLIRQYAEKMDSSLTKAQNNMLLFRDYLVAKRISQPTPSDVTLFILDNPLIFSTYGAVNSFLLALRAFFRQVSQTTGSNGQIMYPNISKYLDPTDLVNALLMRLHKDQHIQSSNPTKVNEGDINVLMKCLKLKRPQDNK